MSLGKSGQEQQWDPKPAEVKVRREDGMRG